MSDRARTAAPVPQVRRLVHLRRVAPRAQPPIAPGPRAPSPCASTARTAKRSSAPSRSPCPRASRRSSPGFPPALMLPSPPRRSAAAKQSRPTRPAPPRGSAPCGRRRPRHQPLLRAGHGLPRRPLQRRSAERRRHHPAVAGPFDLGTIVVRAALYPNPATAQVTRRLRSAAADARRHPAAPALDHRRARPRDFTLNPTDCTATSVNGQRSLSTDGAIASPPTPSRSVAARTSASNRI